MKRSVTDDPVVPAEHSNISPGAGEAAASHRYGLPHRADPPVDAPQERGRRMVPLAAMRRAQRRPSGEMGSCPVAESPMRLRLD
jgi:hypothetical protein